MSIINTLREKMGKVLVVVVGLSILAFVLGDLATGNSSLLGGGPSQDIGEIAGETITREEFNAMVDGQMAQYGGGNEAIRRFVRDQVWQQLVSQISYSQRLEELNMVVGDAEKFDMVRGNNIAPLTGQFTIEYLEQQLAQLSASDLGRVQWLQFQSQMHGQRQLEKYQNFFLKSNYVTLAEAKNRYEQEVGRIDVDYLYVPYSAVADTEVSVSDSELTSYLNDHKDEFQVEESRSIEYVSFPVVPSAKDSAAFKADIDEIVARFQQSESVEQDSLIGTGYTEQGVGFTTYDLTALPVDIENNISTLKAGDIVGPKLSDGIYSLNKLSAIVDGENEYARASQIVIQKGATDASKREARTKALGILREVRNGADFAETARTKSEDGSGPAGGDMGWYRKDVGPTTGGNPWPQELQDATFGANRTGIIRRLIESETGYHIVNVVNAPSEKRYKVATIIIEMIPSSETQNDAYRQVQDFMANARDLDAFNSHASEQGISVFSSNNIAANANGFGRITDGRQVVTWLYGEASLEDVKDFELEDEYIVGVYKKKIAKGTAKLEDVRDQIEPIVKNMKKAELIKSKMAGLSGSMDEMRAAYGAGAVVYSAAGLSMVSNSLPNVGPGPEAVGTAFALQNVGERSKPVSADAGVVLLELKLKSPAPEIADYTNYMTTIQQRTQTSAGLKLNQSITDAADITDERHKFY